MARAESPRLGHLLFLTAAVTLAGVTPAVPAEWPAPMVKVSEAPDQLIDIGAGSLDRESGVRELHLTGGTEVTGRLAAHSEYGSLPGSHRTTFCASNKQRETVTFQVSYLHKNPETGRSFEPIDTNVTMDVGPEPMCRTVEANGVPGTITLVYLDHAYQDGSPSFDMETWEHRRNPAEREGYRVERGPAAQGPLNQVVPRLRADARLGR